MTATEAMGVLLALALGAGFGRVHLALLARQARRIVAGRAGAGEVVLGYVLRMALAFATIYLGLRLGGGIAGAVAAVAGYQALRLVVLRRVREG